MTFLHTIKAEVEREVEEAKKRRDLGELKRMARNAPPALSFPAALSAGFGIIAEIKRRSPSAGEMRPENFHDAPSAYETSRIVKAISVLTNSSHFGMSMDDLLAVKSHTRKPVLRKDFVFTEYQVHQARAYGADAVLLMVNLIDDRETLKRLHQLTRELGMEALIEAHDQDEIGMIPEGASICGLNSRRFKASKLSVDLQTFDLIQYLPKSTIKVAESGVDPSNIVAQVKERGFDVALIGTSLLKAPEGIRAILSEFESALDFSKQPDPGRQVTLPA